MDMEERQEHTNEAPHVDFSLQLSLAREAEHVEANIFEQLKAMAQKIAAGEGKPLGALIVLGDFDRHGPQVDGMVQMKPKQNPVESLLMIDSGDGDKIIRDFSESPFDGAIVVNRNGQILGAGIYLVVDNPMLETPEDCGTRHKAAASFSERKDVISVLTLSEETNTVRLWKSGKTKNVFRVDVDKANKE